jgi:transposase
MFRLSSTGAGYDQSPTPRRLEFIGFWGYLVFLVYCMRRVNCKHCGGGGRRSAVGHGKHSSTKVHMFWGIGRANSPGRKPPKNFALPGIRCMTRWRIWSPGGWSIGSWERFAPLAWMRRGKGHKYLTLVYQIDLGCTRMLWIGKERTVKTFREFFTMIGPEVSAKIEFVCSEMWKPYLGVIR